MRSIPKGKNFIVLLVALIALVIPVVLLENSLLHHTNGNISFPLDDAFLNLSIGRNLAFYKVWGVSKFVFQPATSSLLYPALLAAIFFITGAHLVVPIILNTIAAIGLLYAIQKRLIRQNAKPRVQLLVLLSVILFSFLPILVVSGMEYPLQLLLNFLFIQAFVAAIQQPAGKLPRQVYIYGLLIVALRYENIFLVGLACIFLTSLSRRRQALQLIGISLLPAIVFGVISVLKGNYFLPTPLIIGPYPIYLFILVIAALLLGFLLVRRSQKVHRKHPPGIRRVAIALFITTTVPFIIRNEVVLRHFHRDSVRIYDQQYPLAAFVHRYSNTRTIGVSDIGAVAYFSEGRKVDFTGAASADVVKYQSDHSKDSALVDSLCRKDGVWAAVISESWLSLDGFPHWNKIASWKLPDTQYSQEKLLTFYTRWDTVYIRKYLHEYEKTLPAGAVVTYY
jgi:uncharacterized membrane protein